MARKTNKTHTKKRGIPICGVEVERPLFTKKGVPPTCLRCLKVMES